MTPVLALMFDIYGKYDMLRANGPADVQPSIY